MAGAPRSRRLLLGVALLATLAAAVWVSGNDPDELRPTRPAAGERAPVETPAAPRAESPAARSESPVATEVPTVSPSARPASSGEVVDLFPRQSWYVAPPPPPPSAPPLPFVYFGQFVDGLQVVVFVTAGERNLSVRAGDVIDGTYRVDSIAPPTMTFTYLPLNQKQTLEIGRVN